MGIPLPALDTRPPQQPEDPLSQYAKVLSLKNMMQQQQLIPGQIEEQRIQIQQAHKAQADQRAADAAFQEWDGKDYSSLPELLRKHGGSADAYMGLRNSLIKQQQEIGTYDETKLKNELTRNDILSGLIDQVQSAPPEQRGQAFQGALQQASRIGVDPQHLQQFSQVANAPIEQQDKALEFVKKGLIAHKAQLEQASKAQADAIARQKAQQEAALAPSQLQKSEADANLAQQEAAFGGKKSQKEMLQRQLIQAENAGDSKAAARFKQQLKDIDPLAQQRIQISLNNASGIVPGQGSAPTAASGEDVLKGVEPGIAATVRAVVAGRQSLNSLSYRNNYRNIVSNLVNRYDPEWSEQRAQIRKAFTSGPDGKNIGALNTATVHLDTLGDAAQALQTGSLTPGNAVYNKVSQLLGRPAPTNFEGVKNAVAGEMAAALKGNATDIEIHNVAQSISASNSPEQLAQGINTAMHILHQKLDTYQQRYEQQIPGDTAWSPVLPQAQYVFEKHGVQGGATVQGRQAAPKLKIGTIEDGYLFKGGDPADKRNWIKK